jgi:hypothetical protein
LTGARGLTAKSYGFHPAPTLGLRKWSIWVAAQFGCSTAATLFPEA